MTAAEVGPTSALRRAMVLATVSLATMLYAMTITVANVVLPQMQGTLSVTQDQIAWTVTFNILATAVATPLTGWLIGRLGRRRLMLYAVLGFTASSILCGMASSLETLVAYRVAQGVFGAPLVPLSQTIILDTFPRRQHGLVTAIWGVGVVVGPIIGPTAGGFIAEAYNWRWVFFMIVPFGMLTLLGAFAFIVDGADDRRRALDWTGFLALSVAIAAFQLFLDRGERSDWFESPEIVAEAVIAAVCVYLFVAHSLTAEKPFLNPRMLGDRNFTLGIIFALIFGMLNFTPMVLFPSLLQKLRGYPDDVIGLLLAARGLGNMASFLIVVQATKLSPRIALAFGFGLQALASWSVAQFDINLTTWGVAWTSALQGFGVGMTWVPLTVITFSTLNQRYFADGTAVFHLLRNFGSSIFIAISVALVIRTTKINYATMTESISPFNKVLTLPSVRGGWDIESLTGLAQLSGEIQRQAAMIGNLNAFYMIAVTGFAALPLLLLVRMPKSTPPAPDDREMRDGS